MLYTFMFLLSLSSLAFADSALDSSIKTFQIEAISEPPPIRDALFKAGSVLFRHPVLSGKENISCMACHSPQAFSGDALPLGIGEGGEGMGKRRQQSQGKVLDRHSMALYNLGTGNIQNYFWDSRVKREHRGWWMTPEEGLNGPNPKLAEIAKTFDSLLAVQAVFPISNHDEMAGQDSQLSNVEAWDEAMKRIYQNKILTDVLKAAYPEVKTLNIAHVGNALAEFERHGFKATQTPWDLYIRGKKTYMNPRMVKGAKLFIGKANCIFCHQGQHMSTFGTQNIGVPQLRFGDRGEVAVNPSGINEFAFRIAPLRNVGVTAPYMHSGVFTNLREVINHYNSPVESFNSFVWKADTSNYRDSIKLFTDPEFMKKKSKGITFALLPKLNLTEDEKEDLHCFLKVGLTDMSFQKNLVDDIVDCPPILSP